MASTYSLITGLCQHLIDVNESKSTHERSYNAKPIDTKRLRSLAFQILLTTRHLEDCGSQTKDPHSSLYDDIANHVYDREKAKGEWSREKKEITDDLLKKAENLVQSNSSLMSVLKLLLCLADSASQPTTTKENRNNLHPSISIFHEPDQRFESLNSMHNFNPKIFEVECSSTLEDIGFHNATFNQTPGCGLRHADFFTTQTVDDQYTSSNIVVNEFDVTNCNSWNLISLQNTHDDVIESTSSSKRGIQQDEGYVTPDQDTRSIRHPDFCCSQWEDICKYNDVKIVYSWESYGDYKTLFDKPFLSQCRDAMSHVWNVAITSKALAKSEKKVTPLREISLEDLQVALSYILVGVAFDGIFQFNEDEQSFSLQEGLHFKGSSPKILQEYCEDFIECANLFHKLSKIIEKNTESRFSNNNGIVYQALCSCVEQWLRLHGCAVQNMPSDRAALPAWASRLCVRLRLLHGLFPPDGGGGAGLLARLFDQVPLEVRPDVSCLLYGVLQSCCGVYFLFLEKWIFEGYFQDEHREFFIECSNPSELSYNRKFWTRGFYLNRLRVPGFLKGIENDIFICGKTLALLRLCASDEPVCKRVKEGYPGIKCCISRAELELMEGTCRMYKDRCKSSCDQPPTFAEPRPIKDEDYFADLRAKSLDKIISIQKEEKKVKTDKKREEFEMLKKNMEDAEARKILDRKTALEEEVKLIEEAERLDRLNDLRREEEREKLEQHYFALSLAADKRKDRAEWKIKRANLHEKRVAFFKELRISERDVISVDSERLTTNAITLCESIEEAKTQTPNDDDAISLVVSSNTENVLNNFDHEQLSDDREWSLALDAADQARKTAVKIKERHMFSDYNILTGEVKSYQNRFSTKNLPDGDSYTKIDTVEPKSSNLIFAETTFLESHPDSCDEVDAKNISIDIFVPEESNVEPIHVSNDETKPEILSEAKEIKQAINIDEIDMTTINYNLRMSVVTPLRTQLELANEAVLRLFLVTHNLRNHMECIRKYFFLLDGEFSYLLTKKLFISIQTGDRPSYVLNVSNLNSLLRSAIRCEDDEYSERLSFFVQEIPLVFRFIDPNMLDCLSMRYRTHWPLNVILTDEAIVKYDKIFKFLIKLQRSSWSLEQVITLLKESSFLYSEQLRQIHLYRHIMTNFIHSLKNYVMTVVFEESWFNFSQEMQQVLTLNDIYSAHVTYVKNLLFKCLLNKRSQKMQSCIEELLGTILMFHQILRSGDQPDAFNNLCNQFETFIKLARYLYKYISLFVNTGYQPHLVQLLSVLSANEFYSKE